MSIAHEFKQAMRARGIEPPVSMIADGCIHRCGTAEKPRDHDAAYLLHLDGLPAGGFENHRDGLGWENWHANGTEKLSDDELRIHRQRIEESQQQRQAEQEARYKLAREQAHDIYKDAAPAPADHPYLVAKGITPHGSKIHDGQLVIPLRNVEGEFTGLQFIAGNGEKRFLPGSKISGSYYPIGNPHGVLIIAEGFSTAASIHESTGHAVAVALNCGNLLPVVKALKTKLPTVQLVIAADDDYRTDGNPGITKALEAAQASGALLAVPMFGTNRPESATDFNDMHQIAGADAVRQCIEDAISNNSKIRGGVGIAEPEPLRRPMPPAEPFPTDALGDVLGKAAKAIESVVQSPPALIGQSLLAAASLAVQHLADIDIDGRVEPLSLWCMSIAVSGERKSAVDALALKAHREHEREQLDNYRLQMQEHALEAQAHEVASRSTAKGKDIDLIANELKKLGPPPDAPLKPLLLMSTPTLEGLHKQFISGLPSLGLFHDDAGEFLGGHSMSAENKNKTASGLSCLWDRGEFDRVRAGDGAEKHFGKRLTMHLMMQPVIAESILSDDVLTGQGFLARCLLTWPASTIGIRQYVEHDLTKEPVMIRYWRLMRDMLSMTPTLREGSRNELAPRTLTLTPEAKERWRAVYGVIELDMTEGGTWASVRAWASKAPSQVLRIAGVLTLIDSPNTGVIQADAIERAALLMNHYLAEAVRIVGTNSVPASVRHAESLLSWCHTECITALHSAAALQFGPNCIRTRQAFDAAIAELEKCGWVLPVEGGAVVDGKQRKRVWTVRAQQ